MGKEKMIRIALLLLILSMGCGVRKTNTEIDKGSEKSDSSKDFIANINENQLKELKSKLSVNFDIYRSSDEFEYTKYYDTSGRVEKETYKTSKTESKDNTKSTEESALKEKFVKNNYFKIRERETVTITHFTKQKNTERNNNLIGVIIFVGAFVLAYFIFKPPK